MEYSTVEGGQLLSAGGIIYEAGSLYSRFQEVPDPRKARGKRYELVTLLVLIFLAKLCGQDRPVEIADWADPTLGSQNQAHLMQCRDRNSGGPIP